MQLGGLHTISEMLRARGSTAEEIIALNNTPAPSSICTKTAGKTAERSMGSALLKTSTSLRHVQEPNSAATQSRPQNCSQRRLHLPHCPFLFVWQHPTKSMECSHPSLCAAWNATLALHVKCRLLNSLDLSTQLPTSPSQNPNFPCSILPGYARSNCGGTAPC